MSEIPTPNAKVVEMSKTYNHCGVILGEENWYPSDRRKYNYICEACHRKKTNEWRRNHPEINCLMGKKWREKNKDYIRTYRQRHVLGTIVNGKLLKFFGVIKRPRPAYCELYEEAKKGLLIIIGELRKQFMVFGFVVVAIFLLRGLRNNSSISESG